MPRGSLTDKAVTAMKEMGLYDSKLKGIEITTEGVFAEMEGEFFNTLFKADTGFESWLDWMEKGTGNFNINRAVLKFQSLQIV